jgi:hypothetical protein
MNNIIYEDSLVEVHTAFRAHRNQIASRSVIAIRASNSPSLPIIASGVAESLWSAPAGNKRERGRQ